MEKPQDEKPILVVGATGKTGRRVVQGLAARGLAVRAGSRSGQPPFDWENQATWGPVLSGVEKVYLTYYPDLAMPGAVDQVPAFCGLALAGGVRRLLLLSGRGEEEARLCEQVVRDSGLEWTLLRSSWFCQNFSEGYLLDWILSGEVVLPAGTAPEPFIDAEDIAEVAVAALTGDGHAGQLYEMTGRRLLTFAEAVEEIARAAGRSIGYREVSPQQYVAMLEEQQVPAEYIWLLNYLFTTVLDGRNAHLTGGVQRALGREPRDFSEYARDTAATGVWDQVRVA
ncbi:MAG: NmrA family transcriptional regulator [Thermodesulfobacteriota bacterium]